MATHVSQTFGYVTKENPLRFHFRSKRRPEIIHIVDLDPNEYCETARRMVKTWERCTCEDFTYRIQPLLRTHTMKPDCDQARCKHIKLARSMLATDARDLLVGYLNKKAKAA